jgi:hypothetical protein
MNVKISLYVSWLSFVIAFVYAGSRTQAQPLGELPPSHFGFTLLDKQTSKAVAPLVLQVKGPLTVHFVEAEFATNRCFLELSNAGAPPVTIEIIKPCDLVLHPSSTNTNGLFTVSRLSAPTFSGGLRIEMVMDGRRCFDLTADKLTVVRLKAPWVWFDGPGGF